MHSPVICAGRSVQVLAHAYNETLAVVGTMPATAAYRLNVEALTKDRLSVIESVGGAATPATSFRPKL